MRGGDFLDLDAALGRGHQDRQADGAVERPCRRRSRGRCRRPPAPAALETFCPSSPVCLVTSGYLNMTSATSATSSRLVMNLTPPKSLPLSLKRPLPRPPAWTWALSTTGLPPSWSNAGHRLGGVRDDDAARHRRARGRQQLFRLVFVDLHVSLVPASQGGLSPRPVRTPPGQVPRLAWIASSFLCPRAACGRPARGKTGLPIDSAGRRGKIASVRSHPVRDR